MNKFNYKTMALKAAKRALVAGVSTGGTAATVATMDEAAIISVASSVLTFLVQAGLNWFKHR